LSFGQIKSFLYPSKLDELIDSTLRNCFGINRKLNIDGAVWQWEGNVKNSLIIMANFPEIQK
jgi:hypothetical protein